MKSIVFLLLALVAMPLHAAEIEAGIHHVVVAAKGDSGDLDIAMSRGFAASAEVFWSERFATHVSASFVNPEAILFPSTPPPDDVDLGTLGLDIYAVTARWHFHPASRLSGFAGAGGAIVQIGNLDDQFGDVFEADFDSETALVAEAGLRYRLRPNFQVELGVRYMPLETEPHIRRATDPNVTLPAKLEINPLIVGAGVTWRF